MDLQLAYLSNDPNSDFPDSDKALSEPNGLIAVGGDLSPTRLVNAYRRGIFPWFDAGDPILWWTPNPRAVLFPHKIHLSKSLRKTLRKSVYTVSNDTAFEQVITGCAGKRRGSEGTWITSSMQEAYIRLNELGIAHSIESWLDGELVGGLYGVSIGRVFFGESMFSRRADASKVAYAHLVAQLRSWEFSLIDCQLESAHLTRFGAENISRTDFDRLVSTAVDEKAPESWTLETNPLQFHST